MPSNDGIISIVSGGPSAALVDLAKVPGTIVAVNSAMLHAPHIDVALSMDRRFANAHWPWMREHGEAGGRVMLRPNSAQNIKERPHFLTIFKNDHKTARMSDDPEQLNGTNSGGCALNYAYHHAREVYLFGFDYCRGPKGEHHFFAPDVVPDVVGSFSIDEKRYRGWAREFDECGPQFKAKGIKIWNVSSISAVTAFPKINPLEFA